MKLKNYEIANANNALEDLVDEKLKGAFKFKLFKIKAALEGAIPVIQKAMEGVDDKDEKSEILDEEQELAIEKLTKDELEDIDLSIRQMVMLLPIIEEEEE